MTDTACRVVSEIVHIPMQDGVKLSAHIHRPAAQGPFPAILMCTPYRKGPLGRPPPIVEHGYATVTFDIRGTGNSEGWNDSIYSDAERQDGYDMVEWCAAQSWCTGNVGMWGISFGAVAALRTAMAAPPHLKAIIARSGTDDPYTEWTNPGGSPRPYMYTCYAPIMTVSNFSPPDPAEVGARWGDIWAERLEKNVPWGIPFVRNLRDGPFWRARSLRGHYDRVRCAVFVVDGWADWYATPLLRIFAHLKAPKRALIGPWSHQWPEEGIPGPRIDWLKEALKWFDYWLKGIDTGVMKEPPVTVFVREYSRPATILLEDKGVFRSECEWPIARTKLTALYLLPAGRLGAAPPDGGSENDCDRMNYDPTVGVATGVHGGGPFNINWVMPLDQQADEAKSLVYASEPLTEPVEVTGQPHMALHVASTASIALFFVKLCDVAPDGTSVLVTKGCLNIAHRESHSSPSYIEPGKEYAVTIDLLACSYRFEKGHRIRVLLAGADFLNVWPTPQACIHTVFRSRRHPSHIVLPVVPPLESPLPKPKLDVSSQTPARPEQPLKFAITRDVLNDTQTLEYAVDYDPRWKHEAAMTVSAKNPAQALIKAGSQRTYAYHGCDVTVAAQCVTTSDDKAFHHLVELEITVNGKRHVNKRWTASVPRDYV